ncbi:Fpg/Nei family DNA glycosylase [Micrococcus lacusdianchii]|uniref:Fpg/Nei family DNA glycosylase n=1 Tax=Micrococcus lacusdianchii TaxID=2915940 RepID=UPI0020061777
MPEGHSLHRLARHVQDVFGGQMLRATSPQGRFADGAALLDGRILERAWAHGKHFFADMAGGVTLHIHLGLYGAMSFGGDEVFAAASSIGAPRRIGEQETRTPIASASQADDDDPRPPATSGQEKLVCGVTTARTPAVVPPPPRDTVRLRLQSEHGWADLVGATTCRVLIPEEVASVLDRLGPDPLNGDDAGRFVERASRTRRPIGAVLMDQAAVAGIGNIFRAESLFRAGLDPWTPAREVGEQPLCALYEDNGDLMRTGVRLGRIVTTTPEHRAAAPGGSHPSYYVYHRQGQPCLVCGVDAIVVEEMATRKLYRCTVCQS